MTEQSILAEAAAASVGGAISASVLYPLEVLKTKMQAEQAKSHENETHEKESDKEEDESQISAIDYAKKMYDNDGVGVFYEGIGTSAFQSACEKALYFFAYTFFKNSYKSMKGGGSIGTVENLVLGGMAEWAHLPITLPIDCLTTKIQTSKNLDANPYKIMMAMFSEKGIKGMYKGWEAYTVLCLKPAIQYTVYEQIKKVLLLSRSRKNGSVPRTKNRNNQTLSAAESFFLGMLARTISTIIVFPYTRAKVMLQANKRNSGEDNSNAVSIPDMLKQMYTEQGLKSLFIGLGPELTRGVLSTAFMMMIKEQIAAAMETLLS